MFSSPKGVLGGAGCGPDTTVGLSFSSQAAVRRYLPPTKLVIEAAPDVSYWIDVAVEKASGSETVQVSVGTPALVR
jgi:hypothetical protein